MEENKIELQQRDKGRNTYPTWYAYGRSQSISYSNKICIYIPCFFDPNKINNFLFVKQAMLHKSCLCIEPNNEEDIVRIINSIKTNIKFISDNSTKRSGGWISISSRILYQVELI